MELTISQIIMLVIMTLAAGLLLAFVLSNTWNAQPPEIIIEQNVAPVLLLLPLRSDMFIAWLKKE